MISPVLLLIFSMTANLAGNIIRKYVTCYVREDTVSGHIYNGLSSLTAAILLLCINGFNGISVFTLLLGILFGIITALQQLANLQALKSGPMSYTTVICSLSTLIPTLCGAVIWNEKLYTAHWIGIALLLGCFLLSVEKEHAQQKKTIRWLLYCGAAFICTGCIGVMQKWHQSTIYREELNAFLIIAFVFSTLYSIAGLFICRKKTTRTYDTAPGFYGFNVIMLVLVAAAGFCAALNNKWNMYLSGIMDSAVFFPLVNGGGLVLTTISAVLFFREKLSLRQWFGMLLGVLSVICLCNPFST